jgi:hypothetical protein
MNAIKSDNRKYLAFAATMIACLAAEEADIARLNSRMSLYTAPNASSNETVRPSK